MANVKIGGDGEMLANAVERLLGKSRAEIIEISKETLEGNLRGVLAKLTPEQVNTDKLAFAKSLMEKIEGLRGEDGRVSLDLRFTGQAAAPTVSLDLSKAKAKIEGQLQETERGPAPLRSVAAVRAAHQAPGGDADARGQQAAAGPQDQRVGLVDLRRVLLGRQPFDQEIDDPRCTDHQLGFVLSQRSFSEQGPSRST